MTESWVQNEVEYFLVYLYDESGAPIGMQYRTSNYAWGEFDNFFFEKNLFGDIVAVYNESGTKVITYTYDAWGNHTPNVLNSTGNNAYASYNPFRYRGYYYDTETGFYYLQSRYYNPQWGRFLNADGYINANGDLIGFNMYAYCSNNPVMGYDPTGHEDVCVENFDNDNNPFNDLGHPQGSGWCGTGSAYNTYAVRQQTTAYDSALGGYHSQSISHAIVNTGYYYIPGVVSVTDSMATTSSSSPYSHLQDPPGVTSGKDFTAKQKARIIAENKIRNGGVVKSDLSGQKLITPQKSLKGVTPSPYEYQIDHITPKSRGGTNSYSNAQVLSRQENRWKWNK